MSMPSTLDGPADVQIDRDYKLEEYKRLCSEVEKQLDRRDKVDERVTQTAATCAAIAGVMVTLGGTTGNILIQELGAAIALFVCPILLGFLACQREKIDLRIAQLNEHLRSEHEAKFLPGVGWETRRQQMFQARPWFSKGNRYHELAPRWGLEVIASRGLFVTIESLFMLAATGSAVMALAHHPPGAVIAFVGLLFLISLASLILSCLIIEHKRTTKSPAIPIKEQQAR